MIPLRVNKGFLEATFKAGQEIVKDGKTANKPKNDLTKHPCQEYSSE